MEDRGADFILKELEKRLGYSLEPAKEYAFTGNGDHYGWTERADGKWNLGLFIEGGRIVDQGDKTMKTGMRLIAQSGQCGFRLTPNQNVVLSDIAEKDKDAIDALVTEHGLDDYRTASGMRRSQIACVSLPTCGLALAESERYLPSLVTALEGTLEQAGLQNDEIIIRSTGCPNGCARPYLGEIGLVGKVPGKYNLYLGAGFGGERLNKLYRTSLTNNEIIEALQPILFAYAKEREAGERFGDFTVRKGYVQATTAGNSFHANLSESA